MEKVRLIVAGSREFDNYAMLEAAINHYFPFVHEIVSGGARGADKLGERYSSENLTGLRVFEADWKRLKYAAGPVRNEQMGDYGDALLAFQINNSSGTGHMISYMQKINKPVIAFRLDNGKIVAIDKYNQKGETCLF